MKKYNSELKTLLTKIKENEMGLLEGGFNVISFKETQLIVGGEDTNNCNGQNCVSGCGGSTNSVPGCGDGGGTNIVAGCGGGPIGKI